MPKLNRIARNVPQAALRTLALGAIVNLGLLSGFALAQPSEQPPTGGTVPLPETTGTNPNPFDPDPPATKPTPVPGPTTSPAPTTPENKAPVPAPTISIPGTGTTAPNTNPFDLQIPTAPGTGLTPSPTPSFNPSPGITLPGTTTSPGVPGSSTERVPTADEAARAEQAKQVSELIKNGKYAEAEEILRKDLAANPQDAGAWFFLAGSQRLQNEFDDAIVSYTKTIEYMPEYGDAYMRRGIVWFQKGDYAVAALDFEFASTLNYNDPRPEMWRGLSLAMLGQPRLAISAYSQAIKFDPLYVPARINRGLAYYEMGDYSAASIDFSEAIRLEPTIAGHYFKRGVALAKRGLTDRAIESYNEALRLDPKFAEAYYNRGVAYANIGKSAEASRDRAKAQQLNPALSQNQR